MPHKTDLYEEAEVLDYDEDALTYKVKTKGGEVFFFSWKTKYGQPRFFFSWKTNLLKNNFLQYGETVSFFLFTGGEILPESRNQERWFFFFFFFKRNKTKGNLSWKTKLEGFDKNFTFLFFRLVCLFFDAHQNGRFFFVCFQSRKKKAGPGKMEDPRPFGQNTLFFWHYIYIQARKRQKQNLEAFFS